MERTAIRSGRRMTASISRSRRWPTAWRSGSACPASRSSGWASQDRRGHRHRLATRHVGRTTHRTSPRARRGRNTHGTLASVGHLNRMGLRQRIARAAIGAALASLAEGCALVVFAEGQVSHAENALVPFRRGVGYLALRAGVPVVPVWLSGTAELYLGRELAVTVGQPREVVGKPTKEATLAVARTLYADVAALAPREGPRAPARKRWVWLTNLF